MLADGGSVPYDWLVVSLGAETATFGVPGVKENAIPFSTYQDAQRVGGRGSQDTISTALGGVLSSSLRPAAPRSALAAGARHGLAVAWLPCHGRPPIAGRLLCLLRR